MINLVLNKAIRSRTTYEIPVLFGNKQMDKKTLFSYSKFMNNICEEVIFPDKNVAIHEYDKNEFIRSTKIYNSHNEIVKSTIFEFKEKNEQGYFFIDRTLAGPSGNSAFFGINEADSTWSLYFNRVDSFLGYKKKAKFQFNEDGDPIEESQYSYEINSSHPILERVFIHSYDYINRKLDDIHNDIMKNGWSINLMSH